VAVDVGSEEDAMSGAEQEDEDDDEAEEMEDDDAEAEKVLWSVT